MKVNKPCISLTDSAAILLVACTQKRYQKLNELRIFRKMILPMTEQQQQIIHQLNLMPESLKKEVLDFIGYLLSKHSAEKEVKKIPQFGSAKGKYTLSNDFDAPLDDFKEYM